MSNLKAYRILAGCLAGLASVVPLLALWSHARTGFENWNLFAACFLSPFAAAALVFGEFALRGGDPRSRMRTAGAILGAIALGTIGFVAGFLGPIVFTPEANQGPLLGIFITGPLGLTLGAPIGWLVQVLRSRGVAPATA